MLVSTSTLGGHVNTTEDPLGSTRRRRRRHTDEFKADAVAAASQPGVSLSAVALSRGINANLLRRWVHMAELSSPTPAAAASALSPASPACAAAMAPPPSAFIPLRLPTAAPSSSGEIRIELRRSTTTITMSWPVAAAAECASWMRELLR
jgi:transposase